MSPKPLPAIDRLKNPQKIMAAYDRQHGQPDPTNPFGDKVEPKPGGKGQLTESEFMRGATTADDRAYRKAAFLSMSHGDGIIGAIELKRGLPNILSRGAYASYVKKMNARNKADSASESQAAHAAGRLAAGAKIGPRQQQSMLATFQSTSDAAEAAFKRPDLLPNVSAGRQRAIEPFRVDGVDMESHVQLGKQIVRRMLGSDGRQAIEQRIEQWLGDPSKGTVRVPTSSDYTVMKSQMFELALHRASSDVLRGLRANTGATWDQFAAELKKGKNLKLYAEWGFSSGSMGG
jgi:hypothetical protein